MKQAIKISDNIYWVGGIDWKLRSFHGYITQRGSTYNAYLIVDEKVTLIDTTKYYLGDELLERISSVIDPSKIDYIISNHVEPDHSGVEWKQCCQDLSVPEIRTAFGQSTFRILLSPSMPPVRQRTGKNIRCLRHRGSDHR